ncbi:hypothetical protein HETIRDRAFT_386615 [Heterobasidion irregulare TC 32-1]|uniref:Uncharacterized protein n=1 Tax=Heterobasidion irregulare (strain TC 32-1) TaxID=747525 RepID=W4K490_HETIT|nr:uncharacterized protein HETIRDRAFT_386615 [Heterobasidion irregulare TC 32-1]ETW80160.1 hypothetical protein HETIRDRAFT_386615 [Heterobasidion irregulare TC 32-1]
MYLSFQKLISRFTQPLRDRMKRSLSPTMDVPESPEEEHTPFVPQIIEEPILASPKCQITGDSVLESTIHRYHMLHERQWINHPLLSHLEWSWGMKYDSMEVDTNENTLYLGQDWLELFESGDCTLMPSMEIMEKLWNRWFDVPLDLDSVSSIEDLYEGEDTFEYHVIPLHKDASFAGNPTGDVSSIYPFYTLPPIVSKLKPHFVACHAGPLLLPLSSIHYDLSAKSISRIYGVSLEQGKFAISAIAQSYGAWKNSSTPVKFVSSPRTIRFARRLETDTTACPDALPCPSGPSRNRLRYSDDDVDDPDTSDAHLNIISCRSHTAAGFTADLSEAEPIPSFTKCFITGDSVPESTIRQYYMLHDRQGIDHYLLSHLEWSWGMRSNSIQLDTVENTVYLREDWRKLFESGDCTLMPSMKIMEQLWKRWVDVALDMDSVSSSIEDLYEGEDTFEYRVIPLHKDASYADNPAGDVYSTYPFYTLPPIVSKLKPHFVACHAGPLLLSLTNLNYNLVVESIARTYRVPPEQGKFAISAISQSYEAWTESTLPAGFVSSTRDPCPTRCLEPDSATCSDFLALTNGSSRKRRRGPHDDLILDDLYSSEVHVGIRSCPSLTAARFDTSTSSDSSRDARHIFSSRAGIEDPSSDIDPMSEGEIDLFIRNWVARCISDVKKSGGWASCVSNDGQVEKYRRVRRRLT